VPAIFAITTDTCCACSPPTSLPSWACARLYFALAAMIDRFAYLKYALASVLIFIGGKIVVADMLGIAKAPPAISLGVSFRHPHHGRGLLLVENPQRGPERSTGIRVRRNEPEQVANGEWRVANWGGAWHAFP
jgi:tellurite resistance protein TerC